MSNIARDNRNRDVTRIQIARRLLNLSDSQYYVMLYENAGVGSSKDLDPAGRERILAHLKALAKDAGVDLDAKLKGKRPRRPVPATDRKRLVARIRAQLISLDRKPDEYADGIAKQMLGDDAPKFYEWCVPRDLYKISQALNVEQIRKGAATK